MMNFPLKIIAASSFQSSFSFNSVHWYYINYYFLIYIYTYIFFEIEKYSVQKASYLFDAYYDLGTKRHSNSAYYTCRVSEQCSKKKTNDRMNP